jgi:hypothetical protein
VSDFLSEHVIIIPVNVVVPEPEPEPEPVKAGSIFSASWGYDQTNVDFYEVVKVSPSGKTVTLQEVGQHRQTSGHEPSDRVVPDRTIKKGQPFRRKLHVWPTGCAVSITSYSWASPWDGSPRHQTGQGWGH